MVGHRMPGWRRSFAALTLVACLTSVAGQAGCGGVAVASAVGSIGVKLGQRAEDRSLYVRGVPEGYPASDAGLQEGDEILMIDGVYVKSMSADEVTKHLRGPIGSSVALTIARGKRVLHMDVKRAALRPAAADPPAEKKLEE